MDGLPRSGHNTVTLFEKMSAIVVCASQNTGGGLLSHVRFDGSIGIGEGGLGDWQSRSPSYAIVPFDVSASRPTISGNLFRQDAISDVNDARATVQWRKTRLVESHVDPVGGLDDISYRAGALSHCVWSREHLLQKSVA